MRIWYVQYCAEDTSAGYAYEHFRSRREACARLAELGREDREGKKREEEYEKEHGWVHPDYAWLPLEPVVEYWEFDTNKDGLVNLLDRIANP